MVAGATDATRTTLVILGATGDLASRLLFPALCRLEAAGRLPELDLVGWGIEDLDTDRFRARLRESTRGFAPEIGEDVWTRFAARLRYVRGELTPEGLAPLARGIRGPALFYLALPPALFAPAAVGLAAHGLADETHGFRRLVVEKPFGTDLASARALNATLRRHFAEAQIFRIDHFLGKETVQNLLVFRFANRFLEPVLNATHVAQVQITAAETLGVEGRFRYYDGIGALRDMIQNHLMQLFTLVAIEPPARLDAEIVRDHKTEILRAVRPLDASSRAVSAVRGVYGAGRVGDAKVRGYLEEPGVPPDSRTETFAAIRLEVDNWRWKGVPFYLRSGKRLGRALTEIAVELREPPTNLFRQTALERCEANWLVFRSRPDEAIELWALAKKPGLDLESRPVVLRAPYRAEGDVEFAAYEQLLLDAIEGDASMFLRFDETELAWEIVTPVLEAWKDGHPDGYEAGSDGPRAQDLILRDGHAWRKLGRPC